MDISPPVQAIVRGEVVGGGKQLVLFENHFSPLFSIAAVKVFHIFDTLSMF